MRFPGNHSPTNEPGASYGGVLWPRRKAGGDRLLGSEVLWWLARERVTAASFFPGNDGAARAILELELSRSPR
jgi:hypothetical protein